MSRTVIQYFAPPGVKASCNAGSSCYIGMIDDETVLKYPFKDDYKELIAVEGRIFEAMGAHPHILKYYGQNEHGLLLEYAANGAVKDYLKKHPSTSMKLRTTWCYQLGDAIAHVHSKHVIHCNIAAINVLLDGDLQSKLADFQGILKDASGATVATGQITEASKWRLPREAGEDSESSDMFAFGSTMYEILSGQEPFPELDSATDDEEIERRFQEQEYPDLGGLPGGNIIRKCWLQGYESAKECLRELRMLKHQFQ